jgi:hypothetical protein
MRRSIEDEEKKIVSMASQPLLHTTVSTSEHSIAVNKVERMSCQHSVNRCYRLKL